MLLALTSLGAAAQPAAPGRIEQDTRAVPQPPRRDAIQIPRPAFAEQAPPGAEAVRFTLAGVDLVGNQALSTAALQDSWAPLVGQAVSLREAFAIAAAIGARYRAAGYVLSQALLPAQELATDRPATLRIAVVEGFIDSVVQTGGNSRVVDAYLAAVTAQRPLQLQTLERALLLVNELPGVSAQANLAAGSTAGATRLELTTQVDPDRYSLLVHNRSTPSLGRVRIEVAAERRGLFAQHDSHGLRFIGSGDARLRMLAYQGEAAAGASGARLQWSASTSQSQPTSPLPNVDTDSTAASLGLSLPLLRSRAAGMTLRASLAGYNNGAGDNLVSRDHIRALRIGLGADLADAQGGINLVDAEFSQGLRILGASDPADPMLNGARPDFRKLNVYLARLQSLPGDWSLLLAATAQWSDHKLPTAEQLGLGGDVFLRGFDPSEVIGENGHAIKAELRWNTALGAVQTTWYGFGENGRVERRQVAAAATAATLGSAGLGVRFSAPGGVRGYLEVAKPLRRDVASEGNRRARWFGGLGIEF
jgi:hemolysin activation/secretion protein